MKHDSSLNEKHACNDFIINSTNVNCVNDMHESIDNYDSDDLIEISLDEHDACYSCGHDANIYEDEFAIVPMRSLLLHPCLIVPLMKSMIAMILL